MKWIQFATPLYIIMVSHEFRHKVIQLIPVFLRDSAPFSLANFQYSKCSLNTDWFLWWRWGTGLTNKMLETCHIMTKPESCVEEFLINTAFSHNCIIQNKTQYMMTSGFSGSWKSLDKMDRQNMDVQKYPAINYSFSLRFGERWSVLGCIRVHTPGQVTRTLQGNMKTNDTKPQNSNLESI